MSQHSLIIPNADGGSNFRAEINEALAAIKSRQSGPLPPSNPVKFEEWIDENDDTLKIFDGSSWVNRGNVFGR